MLVLPDNQDRPAPGEWKAAESALRVWRFAGERMGRPTPSAPPTVIGQAGRAATAFAEGRVSRLGGVGLHVWDFLTRFFRRRDAAGDDFTPEMLLARRRPLVVRLPATGAFRPVPAISVPRRAVPDPRIPEQTSQQTSERVIHKTLYAFVTRTLPFRWRETDRPAARLLSSPAAEGPISLPSPFPSPPLPGRQLSHREPRLPPIGLSPWTASAHSCDNSRRGWRLRSGVRQTAVWQTAARRLNQHRARRSVLSLPFGSSAHRQWPPLRSRVPLFPRRRGSACRRVRRRLPTGCPSRRRCPPQRCLLELCPGLP